MGPLRVLLVTSSAKLGGAERFVEQLAHGLLQRGHNVLVLCPPDGWLGGILRQKGIPVVEHSMRGCGLFRVPRLVSHFLNNESPTILHSHLTGATYATMLCHWRFGSPVVATVHHLSSISYRNQALGAAERALAALGIRRGHTDWIFRQIARHGTLVAVSNFVRQCLILDKIPAERVQVIYNGTPFADEELPLPDPTARNEFNLPSDAVVLGVVGHICPSKGQLLAVQALGELPDQLREKVRLLLIGRLDRQFAPLLKGAIEQLGLSDRVILTGERRDIQRLVSILDLLIHPSQAEACPISVIEALALGKPVIATRVGGLSEVVTHETDGLLIEPTVQALTSAILFLADNSAERSRMGALARQHAIELFSSETMVSRYEALYRQLLNSEKGIS